MAAKMTAVGYAASLPIRKSGPFSSSRRRCRSPEARPARAGTGGLGQSRRRQGAQRKQGTEAEPVILGWDAAGTVEAAARCRLFKPGDDVYYAGNVNRPGTNAQFHLVDERIVGRKPKSLDFAASRGAAAHHAHRLGADVRPHRREARRGSGPALALIVGGAGGVGSIAIQLARKLTGLTVIATASRPETQDWVKGLGAHHVIDHSKPFAPQLKVAGFPTVDIVLSLTGPPRNAGQVTEVISHPRAASA